MLYASLINAKLVTAMQTQRHSTDDAFLGRLMALGACVHLQDAMANEVLIAEGEPAASFFIVYEGILATQKRDASAPPDLDAPPLLTYGVGATGGVYTGELGLLRGLALSGRQVVAQQKVTLLAASRSGLAKLIELVPELRAELQLKLIRRAAAPLQAILDHPLASMMMQLHQKKEFIAAVRASGAHFGSGDDPARSSPAPFSPAPSGPAPSGTPNASTRIPAELWQFWRDASTFQELAEGSYQDESLVDERLHEAQAIVKTYLGPTRQSGSRLGPQRRFTVAIPDEVKARTVARVRSLPRVYQRERRLDSTIFQEAIDAVFALARQHSIVTFRASTRFADLRRKISAHPDESCFADVAAFDEALASLSKPGRPGKPDLDGHGKRRLWSLRTV